MSPLGWLLFALLEAGIAQLPTASPAPQVLATKNVVATLHAHAEKILSAVASQLQQGLLEQGLHSGVHAGTARVGV